MITKRRSLLPTGSGGGGGANAPVSRLYAESGSYLYAGVAPQNSDTDVAAWRITRIEIDGHEIVSTLVATDAVWDDRATETYS